MSNIGKFLHKPADPRVISASEELVSNNTYLGIEIELEDMPVREEEMDLIPYWQQTVDHSLRGRWPFEYRLALPCAGQDVVRALEQFSDFVENKPGDEQPSCNERTSLHIHMDVRNLSPRQLLQLVAVYMSVEHLLYSYVSPERENSIFCLPLYKASEEVGSLMALGRAVSTEDPGVLGALADRSPQKYGGLNVGVLFEKGSIEFRMHEGEWRAERILEWINILLSLKKYATEAELNLLDFPMQISSMGVGEYVYAVFGSYTEKLLYPMFATHVLEDVRRAQEVLFSQRLEESLMYVEDIKDNKGEWPSLDKVYASLFEQENSGVLLEKKDTSAEKKTSRKLYKDVTNSVEFDPDF